MLDFKVTQDKKEKNKHAQNMFIKNLHKEANCYVLFRKRLPYGIMILSAVIYYKAFFFTIKLPQLLFYISNITLGSISIYKQVLKTVQTKLQQDLVYYHIP